MGPISTKLGTKYPWVKGSKLFFLKLQPCPLPRKDYSKMLKHLLTIFKGFSSPEPGGKFYSYIKRAKNDDIVSFKW